MKGFMRRRGDAWELRVYVGTDPVTGKQRYASRTVRRVRVQQCRRLLGAVVPGLGVRGLKRLCALEGVPGVRLHDLRHFVASQLLGAGVDVRTVAGRLGHRNAATTLNVHAHFLEQADRGAADLIGRVIAGDPDDTRRSGP